MISHLSTIVSTTDEASASGVSAAFVAINDSFLAASDRFTAVGRLQKAEQELRAGYVRSQSLACNRLQSMMRHVRVVLYANVWHLVTR